MKLQKASKADRNVRKHSRQRHQALAALDRYVRDLKNDLKNKLEEKRAEKDFDPEKPILPSASDWQTLFDKMGAYRDVVGIRSSTRNCWAQLLRRRRPKKIQNLYGFFEGLLDQWKRTPTSPAKMAACELERRCPDIIWDFVMGIKNEPITGENMIRTNRRLEIPELQKRFSERVKKDKPLRYWLWMFLLLHFGHSDKRLGEQLKFFGGTGDWQTDIFSSLCTQEWDALLQMTTPHFQRHNNRSRATLKLMMAAVYDVVIRNISWKLRLKEPVESICQSIWSLGIDEFHVALRSKLYGGTLAPKEVIKVSHLFAAARRKRKQRCNQRREVNPA